MYWGFYGKPWIKTQIAAETASYDSQKYNRVMRIDEPSFSMKDGSYGASVYAEDDSGFRIHVAKVKVSPTDYEFQVYDQ